MSVESVNVFVSNILGAYLKKWSNRINFIHGYKFIYIFTKLIYIRS